MSPVHCGLDFGTTNSSLAVFSGNTPQIIPIDEQNNNPSVLKSLLYLNPRQESAVGASAIKNYLSDLDTLPSVPLRLEETGRLIKTFGPSTASGVGPVVFVPEIIEVDDSGRGRLLQSLKSVLTNPSFTGTNIFGKFYSLEELLGILMQEIKSSAETHLGHTLDSVVLGRPVKYVGTGQNQTAIDRMVRIATSAGFKNIEFELEPIGAALNYGINIKNNQNILVFDFGGGTLDICVMKLPEKKILSVSGRGIGGDLLNSRIVQAKIAKYFGVYSQINHKVPFPSDYRLALTSWYRTSLLKNVKDLGMLKDLSIRSTDPEYVQNFCNLVEHDYAFDFFSTIDRLKVSLSTTDSADFNFHRSHLNLQQTITRNDFENSIINELDESKLCINEALSAAGLKSTDIDQVILTGGSSQTPVFRQLVDSIFTPDKIIASDYFTAVAAGLSIRAHQIFGS
ncbi:Hsp70 family protein [Candidatus Shapirobacteria bacterium]|nr:Hsp70 family protein [Candidatus Shapirobacteria bacterium]